MRVLKIDHKTYTSVLGQDAGDGVGITFGNSRRKMPLPPPLAANAPAEWPLDSFKDGDGPGGTVGGRNHEPTPHFIASKSPGKAHRLVAGFNGVEVA